MNRLAVVAAGLLAFAAGSGVALAEDLVTTIEQGCKAEIGKYCSQVTLGEGRMLACFYAHEDKLSGQCQYALYDAAARLERAISDLNYVATQCGADIETHCAKVEMGEGRIMECLNSKPDVVSAPCKQAIADVTQ
jgi:hypothetical protein